MDVSANGIGLTATVTRPTVQANKWTIMRAIVTLRASSGGRLALAPDESYVLPGWGAEVGGTGAPCTSNNDRVRWPAGRRQVLSVAANETVTIPVEFACGYGAAFAEGGQVSLRAQLLLDDGSGTRTVRLSASDLPYTRID